MATAGQPVRTPNSQHFYSNVENTAATLPFAINEGVDLISLSITAKEDKLPHRHPKQMKEELTAKIPSHPNLVSINLSRQGKLFLSTRSVVTAQEILAIEKLFDIPVCASVLTESISSRFLIRLDTEVSCEEIAVELGEQKYAVLEVRRFMRKDAGVSVPTPSVLVTIFGTSLPTEVRLWYQNFRIQPFIDRPRACSKCHGFNHSSLGCRSSEVLCKSCGLAHPGACEATTFKCANCNGNHKADDKTCPKYLQELQFQKFRSENHLPLRDARRLFKPSPVHNSAMYAKVVASSPAEIVTKCELDTTKMEENFKILAAQMVNALQTYLQQAVEALYQNLAGLMQAPPSKKNEKVALSALHESVARSFKKVRLDPENMFNIHLPMEVNHSG